jgi:hypothetical protein
MKPIPRLSFTIALPALVLIAFLTGCGKENPAPSAHNLPPDTTLDLLTDRADTTSLKVHLRWSGTDPDGEVVCFETRWDTLGWIRAARSESVFVLSERDSLGSSVGPGRHTFVVRAIDDRGAEDPSPASVSFTARNLLPETEIVSGPVGVSCPVVRFEWRGWDYDGIVVGYGWRLWEWSDDEWFEVASAESVGADEVTAVFGPIAGLHRFEVWSIDDSGDVDPTPAAAQFTANPELAGSRLVVRTNVFGDLVYRGAVWPAEFDEPIAIFEREHLAFDWQATIDDCGGDLVGYSVAYDDTSDWCDDFSLQETHFEVTPTVGEHAVYVAAADDLGMLTRGKLAFEVVEAGMSDNVLIVDDYDWLESNLLWGSDAERDAFYEHLTAECGRPVLQWDVGEHVGSGGPEPPDVATLAGASTVIWYYDHEGTGLSNMFDPFGARYVPLAGYARAGGNLIMAGYKGLSQILDEDYPIEISASDSTQGRVFVRDVLGIASAENSGQWANKNAPWAYGYCFYGAVPRPHQEGIQLEAMYIDSLGTWWPLYGMDDPNYSHGGLPMVEAMQAWPGGGVEAQVIEGYLNVNFYGEPCTIVAVPEEGRGQVCYFGFPLYYLQVPHVSRVFHTLLERYGEL